VNGPRHQAARADAGAPAHDGRDSPDKLTRVFLECIAKITTVQVVSAEEGAIGRAGDVAVRPCAQRGPITIAGWQGSKVTLS
jgi:hypothetical protein